MGLASGAGAFFESMLRKERCLDGSDGKLPRAVALLSLSLKALTGETASCGALTGAVATSKALSKMCVGASCMWPRHRSMLEFLLLSLSGVRLFPCMASNMETSAWQSFA